MKNFLTPTKQKIAIFLLLSTLIPYPFYVVFAAGFLPSIYLLFYILLFFAYGPVAWIGLVIAVIPNFLNYLLASLLLGFFKFRKALILIIFLIIFASFVPIYRTSLDGNLENHKYTDLILSPINEVRRNYARKQRNTCVKGLIPSYISDSSIPYSTITNETFTKLQTECGIIVPADQWIYYRKNLPK